MNYSLLYNMDKLSGSLYLNGIFMGLFRYSMNLSIAFLDLRFKRLGRKFAHFIADALSASALTIYAIIYLLGWWILILYFQIFFLQIFNRNCRSFRVPRYFQSLASALCFTPPMDWLPMNCFQRALGTLPIHLAKFLAGLGLCWHRNSLFWYFLLKK